MPSNTGRIVNDYHGVDTTSQNFGTIINNCEEACDRITNLEKQLDACFTGDAAGDWKTQITQLMTTARQYRTDLADLKTKITNTSGYAGVIQQTDKQLGQKFLSAY